MDARFETAINDLCGVYSRFTETVTSILLKLPVRSKDTGKFEVNSRKVAYLPVSLLLTGNLSKIEVTVSG